MRTDNFSGSCQSPKFHPRFTTINTNLARLGTQPSPEQSSRIMTAANKDLHKSVSTKNSISTRGKKLFKNETNRSLQNTPIHEEMLHMKRPQRKLVIRFGLDAVLAEEKDRR